MRRYILHSPYVIQAWQTIAAGGILALGALNANRVEATTESGTLNGLGNLIGGMVFPIGLIGMCVVSVPSDDSCLWNVRRVHLYTAVALCILRSFLTGANQSTGNYCMYVVPSALNDTAPSGRAYFSS
mmetsp:Transcript_6423/g.14029  ORF Transcript_6423/g.14029 Transcript_6423/m.14029 type:complete len:128 (+) Transcript_6423:99-482(+)